MLQESDIIPYHLSLPPGERVLVLAPHPDDETFGCGGTIRLLASAKKNVKVIFLTSGDKGDPSDPRSRVHPSDITPPSRAGLRGKADHITEYSLLREKEAGRALKVLGVSDYEFLRFPDRGLQAEYSNVLEALLLIVREFSPDALYSPSTVEVNPDHRATAALAMEVQRSAMDAVSAGASGSPLSIVFYEVALPLRPNVLVDITQAYRKKMGAAKKYKSQLKAVDYLRHIAAINTIRALTVTGARYVEAFWVIDKPQNQDDVTKWLSYG